VCSEEGCGEPAWVAGVAGPAQVPWYSTNTQETRPSFRQYNKTHTEPGMVAQVYNPSYLGVDVRSVVV
jgi:hypothetical protein